MLTIGPQFRTSSVQISSETPSPRQVIGEQPDEWRCGGQGKLLWPRMLQDPGIGCVFPPCLGLYKDSWQYAGADEFTWGQERYRVEWAAWKRSPDRQRRLSPRSC